MFYGCLHLDYTAGSATCQKCVDKHVLKAGFTITMVETSSSVTHNVKGEA